MDVVRLLPDSVANQIAAGEVIQRPASCLKELVENSLDAGATRVQIIVRDAGRTMLQVIDNGKGMSETDARMAFERHATSKIREAADLFSLRTMGFRGEALPSICAVSQVEMQTRTADSELGTLLEISGSQVQRQEPVQCPIGTNIKVRNLFFNVPARRRFLKTDQTEMRNLLQEFYRIALVYPKVAFTLVSQDEVLLDLPAATEKLRIEALFGSLTRHTFSHQLVEIASDTELVSIRGFVGRPEDAGKNSKQYFFVNGRFMRHAYFHKAVMTAYEGMLTGGVMPSYFIYFDIDPASIDVNIHPTKTEIKFADEQLIFPILLATVREALGKFNVVPSIDFDTAGKIDIPSFPRGSSSPAEPATTGNTNYNPFSSYKQSRPMSAGWKTMYDDTLKTTELVFSDKEESESGDVLSGLEAGEVMQLQDRYFILPSDAGLLLISRYRAHVCVLYDTCMKRLAAKDIERQQMLFPEIWDLDTDDVPFVEQMREDLLSLGFDLERIAPRSFSVSAVPAVLDGSRALETLQNILDNVKQTGLQARDILLRQMALVLAQNAAVRDGKPMTGAEAENLCSQLLKLKEYTFTPDGKKTMHLLKTEEINKLF